MAITGQGGTVTNDINGYDEPSGLTGNRSQTDYSQQPEVNKTRGMAFLDGTGRSQ